MSIAVGMERKAHPIPAGVPEADEETRLAVRARVKSLTDTLSAMTSAQRLSCIEDTVRIAKSVNIEIMSDIIRWASLIAEKSPGEEKILEEMLADPVIAERMSHVARVAEVGFALSDFSLSRIGAGISGVKNRIYEIGFRGSDE